MIVLKNMPCFAPVEFNPRPALFTRNPYFAFKLRIWFPMWSD